MAYYIMFFNEAGKVTDVVRYAECEYDEYIKHLDRLKTDQCKIQYGYF